MKFVFILNFNYKLSYTFKLLTGKKTYLEYFKDTFNLVKNRNLELNNVSVGYNPICFFSLRLLFD